MKELIKNKLQTSERVSRDYWAALKEAAEREDLTRLIDCVEAIKKTQVKESTLESVLIDLLRSEDLDK